MINQFRSKERQLKQLQESAARQKGELSESEKREIVQIRRPSKKLSDFVKSEGRTSLAAFDPTSNLFKYRDWRKLSGILNHIIKVKNELSEEKYLSSEMMEIFETAIKNISEVMNFIQSTYNLQITKDHTKRLSAHGKYAPLLTVLTDAKNKDRVSSINKDSKNETQDMREYKEMLESSIDTKGEETK